MICNIIHISINNVRLCVKNGVGCGTCIAKLAIKLMTRTMPMTMTMKTFYLT